MPKYIVRPYYGHDCDSVNGFNNGHFLSAIEVTAPDSDAAIDRAIEHLRSSDDWNLDGIPSDSWFGENILYWEYDHNECGDYLYQYIDFNYVELVSDNESGVKHG